MLIYDALRKDHEGVKLLLEELVGLSEDDDRHFELVEQIRDELVPHSRAEEKVFYNSLRALHADSDEVMHGYKEHLHAETLLRKLQAKNAVNMDWKKTAQELKAAVEHHIEGEETNLFALAKKMFSDQEAEKIGAAFEQLKPQIKKEGFVKTTLDMMANLMPPRFQKSVFEDQNEIH